jgi:hypothetical protein
MRKKKRSSLALLLLLLLPLFSGIAEDKKSSTNDYALIYGTVFGPEGNLVRGVRVLIRKSDAKKPKYEHISDLRGEFAQRVPPGPADYIVYVDPKSLDKKSKLNSGQEVKVHFEKDERQDIALHLTTQ